MESRDPRTAFYLATVSLNLDGSLDLGFEVPNDFDTEREAVAWLKDQAPCEGYVYRVEPIAAHVRGPFKLRMLSR